MFNQFLQMRTFLLSILICLSCLYSGFSQSVSNDLRSDVRQAIMKGQYDKAISTLESIDSIGKDTTGLYDALIYLYIFKKDWDKILKVPVYNLNECKDTSLVSLARFISKYPKERISDDPAKLRYKYKAGGPVIKVRLNGKMYRFGIQTTTSISILSSDVAKRCRVKSNFPFDTRKESDNEDDDDLFSGVIDSLEIGQLKVYNHACCVIDKWNLELKVLGVRIFKIDGILGWNFLQEFDVNIFKDPKKISFISNKKTTESNYNFIWLGYPFVSCKNPEGDSLLFMVEAGTFGSKVFKSYLSKTDTTNVRKKKTVIFNEDSKEKINSFFFDEINLIFGDQIITLHYLESLPTFDFPFLGLMEIDGVIGVGEYFQHNVYFNSKKGYLLFLNSTH